MSLVNLDRIDQPVSLAKIDAVTLHVTLAGGVTGHSGATLSLSVESGSPEVVVSGPITADGVGENADVVEEEFGRIAVLGGPACLGCAPSGRVGATGGNVGGGAVAREEPRSDSDVVVPYHGVDSTSVVVVANTVIGTKRGLDTAAFVAGFGGGAVRGKGEVLKTVSAELGVAGRVDVASRGSVDGVGVLRGEGDTFNDVDLTSVGPASSRVGGYSPPSGPSTTTDRHVRGIEDEDTGREGVVRVDTNGFHVRDGSGGGRSGSTAGGGSRVADTGGSGRTGGRGGHSLSSKASVRR